MKSLSIFISLTTITTLLTSLPLATAANPDWKDDTMKALTTLRLKQPETSFGTDFVL